MLTRRFKDLLDVKYFDACRFHRVVEGFIVQWGIPADPKIYRQWGENKIKDDPVKVSNKAGTLSFATSGPNARGSQMFVNFGDNSSLDDQGFAPFATILEGFESIQQVYGGYARNGPDQQEAKERVRAEPAHATPNRRSRPALFDHLRIRAQPQGNDYLAKDFPKLSYIESVEVL